MSVKFKLRYEERKQLDAAFIRVWASDYFFQQLYIKDTLYYCGDKYLIQWVDSQLKCLAGKKVGLSFRKTIKENKVLIKSWKEEKEVKQ
jgi:hypothetical protein